MSCSTGRRCWSLMLSVTMQFQKSHKNRMKKQKTNEQTSKKTPWTSKFLTRLETRPLPWYALKWLGPLCAWSCQYNVEMMSHLDRVSILLRTDLFLSSFHRDDDFEIWGHRQSYGRIKLCGGFQRANFEIIHTKESPTKSQCWPVYWAVRKRGSYPP